MQFAAGNDSDSEDSMFGNESDSDSDDDAAGGSELAGRAKWLKTAVVAVKKEKRKESSRVAGGDADAKLDAKMVIKSVQHKEIVYTKDEIIRKVADLMASRGRRGTDLRDVLRKLETLAKASRKFGANIEIPVLMNFVSTTFDSQRGIDDFLIIQQWRMCYRCLLRITTLLNENESLSLSTIPTEDAADIALPQVNLMKIKEEDTEDAPSDVASDLNVINVVGTLESFIKRLEDEYTKALQQINPHTSVSFVIVHCWSFHYII